MLLESVLKGTNKQANFSESLLDCIRGIEHAVLTSISSSGINIIFQKEQLQGNITAIIPACE
jgi:hypothetical protein